MDIINLTFLSIAAALITVVSLHINKKWKKKELSKKRYRVYQLFLGVFLAFIVYAMVFGFIIPFANYKSS